MRASPSLLEVQNWLRWVITDPRGVEDALSNRQGIVKLAPQRYREPASRLLHLIVETDKMPVTERLSVYAEAYFSRLLEALENDFEVTAHVLGEEFPRICAEYLEVHPSRSSNIENVGRSLPEFLKSHELASEYPFVAELASLEWGKTEAFYAYDSDKIDPASLKGATEESWGNATFKIDPSLRAYSFQYPVDQLLSAESTDQLKDRIKKIKKTPAFVFVQKIEGWPQVRPVSEDQFKAIQSMKAGKTLGELVSNLQEAEPSELMAWFSQWMQTGLISEVYFERTP
jgi:hypothetical protein